MGNIRSTTLKLIVIIRIAHVSAVILATVYIL